MDNQNYIFWGLVLNLVGSLLLASEAGLLEALLEITNNFNSAIKKRKETTGSKLLHLAIVLIAEAGLRKILDIESRLIPLWTRLRLYLLNIPDILSYIFLSFLTQLVEKFGTKRSLGKVGAIFLILGFLLQVMGNSNN